MRLALPDAVAAAAMRADSRDGVLTVHVAKTKIEARKQARIKVQ